MYAERPERGGRLWFASELGALAAALRSTDVGAPSLDLDAVDRFAEAVAETRTLLEDAAASRTLADVPVGAFLSGGVDSSTVVALMAQRSTRPVLTFSIDLPEGDGGEARWAALVARRYATDHTELVVRPDMVPVLPRIVQLYGEPFADPSAVPTWYVSELARRRVTVALSGDGCDQVFGGYTRYAHEEASPTRSTRSTACSISTPGPTCPTTSSPRSTSPRWPTRWRCARRWWTTC